MPTRLQQSLILSAPVVAALLTGCGPAIQGMPPHPMAMQKMAAMPAPGQTPMQNREQYAHLAENDFKSTQDSPLSTFSIDVDTAGYANVRRFLRNGNLPPVDAVRIEEMVNYFDYDYPAPSSDTPFSISTEVTNAPWNSAHRLVRIGLKGKAIDNADMPPSNLVFLIDVSGSMHGRLNLVKSSLRLLVNQMRSQDRIAIVVYAGAAGLVLPATAGSDKARIMTAIDGLSAGGSTAGGQGIKLAYKVAEENKLVEGNNRVILATDGDFNVGASSPADLHRLVESQRDRGIDLSVLGFGMGNLHDANMETLANKGNGNYAYIDSLLEAKKVLVEEMGGTLLTIAKDVKIQAEFNPAKVQSYRLVGYENRLLNNRDFSDDRKDAGDIGAGHTVTALYEIVPAKAHAEQHEGLKYSRQLVREPYRESQEIMTIKLRYKRPEETQSQQLSHAIVDKENSIDQASTDLRFASAVAEFGLLLRKSKYKANADYGALLTRAKGSKATDKGGYRAEFIRLAELARQLDLRDDGKH